MNRIAYITRGLWNVVRGYRWRPRVPDGTTEKVLALVLPKSNRWNDWLAWLQRPFTDEPWVVLQEYGRGYTHWIGRAKHIPSRLWRGWTQWFFFRVLAKVVGYRAASRMQRWWAFRYQRKFILFLNDSETLCYIDDLATPKSNWMGTVTNLDFPPPENDPNRGVQKGLSFVMGFDVNTPEQYWRACLPFPYWKVQARQHKTRVVRRDDPLVRDYMILEEYCER